MLTLRQLNRATLDRQLLLRRHGLSVAETLNHLVGLQAQAVDPPYYGLWTRLDGFTTDDLAARLTDRTVVRTVLQRSTIHLVTAGDALALRPALQSVSERGLRSSYGKQLVGVDTKKLIAYGRELLEAQPLTPSALEPLLAERFPGFDKHALAMAVRVGLPLVQIPPRGLWHNSAAPLAVPADHWIGRPLGTDTTPDAMIRRYLAAFGPASVADIQAWSGLTGLKEVVPRLGLRSYRSFDGRDLVDLPDAVIPDGDVPAPLRFVPEFDNLVLSFADRTRVIADEHRVGLVSRNGIVAATILVDGFVRGMWQVKRTKKAAVLRIRLFTPLDDLNELLEEGGRLLRFAAPESASHDITFDL